MKKARAKCHYCGKPNQKLTLVDEEDYEDETVKVYLCKTCGKKELLRLKASLDLVGRWFKKNGKLDVKELLGSPRK